MENQNLHKVTKVRMTTLGTDISGYFMAKIHINLFKVLDIISQLMYNIEKIHMILDEMIMNGRVVETCKNKILTPLQLMDSQR